MKRLSLFLSCIMLVLAFVTTIGAPVLEHFCSQQRMVTESCPMHEAKSCCQKKEVPKDDCCKNQIKFEKFSSDYVLKTFKTDDPVLKIDYVFSREIASPILLKSPLNFNHGERGSPPIARDIPVFIQSFLI